MSFFKLLYNIYICCGMLKRYFWYLCSTSMVLSFPYSLCSLHAGVSRARVACISNRLQDGADNTRKKKPRPIRIGHEPEVKLLAKVWTTLQNKTRFIRGNSLSLSVWVYLTCCLSAMFIDFFYPLPRTCNYLLSGRFPIFTSALRSFIRVFKRLIKSSGESTSKIFSAHPCGLTSW